MTPRLPSSVKAKRGRRWRGEIDRGPGSSDIDPAWSKLTIFTKPMTRRRMRSLAAEALADPTLQSIKFWQVDE